MTGAQPRQNQLESLAFKFKSRESGETLAMQ